MKTKFIIQFKTIAERSRSTMIHLVPHLYVFSCKCLTSVTSFLLYGSVSILSDLKRLVQQCSEHVVVQDGPFQAPSYPEPNGPALVWWWRPAARRHHGHAEGNENESKNPLPTSSSTARRRLRRRRSPSYSGTLLFCVHVVHQQPCTHTSWQRRTLERRYLFQSAINKICTIRDGNVMAGCCFVRLKRAVVAKMLSIWTWKILLKIYSWVVTTGPTLNETWLSQNCFAGCSGPPLNPNRSSFPRVHMAP